MEETFLRSYFNSPIGILLISADHKAIRSIEFIESDNRSTTSSHTTIDAMTSPANDPSELLDLCKAELTEWFNGTRKTFTVPLFPAGTDFMQKAWNHVAAIPYGETRTYGDIARKLGDIKLSRAVGLANGSNPIPIIIPCHRVIGQNGMLTGYGGGLWRKEWLLHHEAMFSGNEELFS